MLRPREEVLDEHRNVRRRIARWTSNVFNRQFWRPFGGAQRPQRRQPVVLYPPEFEVEARPVEDVDAVEDVIADDNEIDVGVRATGSGFSTVFRTAAGTDIDPVNVNRPWLHQWIGGFFPRSIKNSQHRVVTAVNREIYEIEFVGPTFGLLFGQSKGREEIVVHGISNDNAHKDAITLGDVVVRIGTVNVATLQELTRFDQVKQLLAQPERPMTIKFLRQNNAIQIRRNRLNAEHEAARIQDADVNNYLDGTRRVTELNARIENELGSNHIEIGTELMYSGITIVLGNIEPHEDEIDSFHQFPVDYYRSPEYFVLREKVEELLPSFHVPCMVYHRVEASRLLKPPSSSPITGIPYSQLSMQSSTDPSHCCANLFDWSKMVRDDWNTHLLIKEIISKNDIDVDSESIAAIKALNGPHLYYHICNNQPVTVIIVCSFAPFGLHEGSAFHKFMELFFYGVSYLVIDLCPIIAPGGVGILGRQNCSANILGLTIHNKIMTKLEGILRPIRDNNQAIIVGWGNASRSGNMGDIIGDYHAKHPCCIYAGHGNMDKDYDSVVSGAKLQMKLFGNTNQHKSEKYLWWIKWIIISNNRAFTRDSVNIGKKIEQSIAWNRVGMYIDYNFKAEKMPTKFWYDDEIEKLLQFCIAEMFANEVNGKKNIDWSLWENFSGSDFTRTDAQKKISKMIINNYGTNKPRTRELFESLLDKITQL